MAPATGQKLHSQRFEVAKYLTETDHQMQPDVLIMSKKVWDPFSRRSSLDQEGRQGFCRQNRELWAAREDEARKRRNCRWRTDNAIRSR